MVLLRGFHSFNNASVDLRSVCSIIIIISVFVCRCRHIPPRTNRLPSITLAAIEAEKEKLNFINGIEHFDTKKLKPTETVEKNPLPTKEIIAEEKKA